MPTITELHYESLRLLLVMHFAVIQWQNSMPKAGDTVEQHVFSVAVFTLSKSYYHGKFFLASFSNCNLLTFGIWYKTSTAWGKCLWVKQEKAPFISITIKKSPVGKYSYRKSLLISNPWDQKIWLPIKWFYLRN